MHALFYVALGIALWLGATYLVRRFNLVQRWKPLARLFGDGGVPWANVRSTKTFGDEQGANDVVFVSRHDIAECGLTCPMCGTLAAERGDFSGVRRMIVNGQENEVVRCLGNRIVELEKEVPCRFWLVASPDTEHGDHLGADGEVVTDGSQDDPEFFRFKRITTDQALREKWGMDVAPIVDEESGMRISPRTFVPIEKGTKHDVLTGEELLNALREASLKQEAEKCDPTPRDKDSTPVTRQPTLPGNPYV